MTTMLDYPPRRSQKASLREAIVKAFYLAIAITSYFIYLHVIDARIHTPSLFLNSAPNVLSVVISAGLFLVFRTQNPIKDSLSIAFGILIYEVLQIFIPDRTFDVFDIFATGIGWMVFLMLVLIIDKAVKMTKYL